MNIKCPSHNQIRSTCNRMRSRWGAAERSRRHLEAEKMQERLALMILMGRQPALQPIPIR